MEKSLEELMADISTGSVGNPPTEVEANFQNNDNVHAVSVITLENKVEEEVKDMVESSKNDFYNIHIDEGLDQLEKEYVAMKRKEQAIDKRIAMIKEENAKVFEEIARLEILKENVLKDEPKFREVIARKLSLSEQKNWKGMEVSFTYVKPYFKDKFNMDKFKMSEPKTYVKYLEKTPVNESVRTKLDLLPVREDELNYGNEDIR